ncbi:MAG: thrombospondin type 3 repeat-containing protein [Gammaproteobacteria bacterium]
MSTICPCDYSLYPQGVLCHCENWILSSYPGSGRREDITTSHLATALSELLHASGSVPTTPIAGVPIGSIDDNESDDRIHQIFAWLVGSDLSGSVGTNGAVHFYTHDGITDAVRINGVTANWTIVDPNGDGHAVLQFTIPDEIQPYYFYWNFEESRNVIMAVETLSDADSYVRVGTFTPSGTEFNFAGINVTALNELINGFSYSKPDTDGDGVADDADNCPSDANADQADADSDGRGDVCDSIEPPADQDGDGVNDDIDNCPAVSNANQSDMDGDGQGDFCDTDIDGDGIENGSDTCPMDATNTCNGSDADGDGVNDDTDNCPSVYNPDQADSNGNGVGDACDAGLRLDSDSDGFVDSEDAFPLNASEQNDADGDGVGDNSDVCPFLANVTDCVNNDINANGVYIATFTASGEEFDESAGACAPVSEPNGKEIVEFVQIGSQLLVRGGDMDDEFEHRGTIATNGDFSVSTVEANFSFTLTGTHVAASTFNGAFTENDNGCEQTATVVFTPAAAITESSVGSAGLTWLESESQWNANSQTETIEAFYGVISDTGPETFFAYDASTRSWVEETEVSNEYLITAGGVVTLQDRFTIDSYLDAGETAVVRAYETDGTTVSTLLEAHVVLEELNIEGMLISKVMGEALGHGLTPDAVFTTGARAFVASITEQNEAYEFWCDDDWNDYVANNYSCANVVAKSYQDLNGDGQDDPVAAIDLDEVVYTPAEFDNGTAVGGGLWAGEGYDAGGDYYLNAYLISDDGTATGSNPLVRVAKHYRNGVSNYWAEKTVIAEFSYSAITRGGISVIQWDLPAIVAKLGDLDAYELHPFIFEESSLDGTALVRRGERVLSGTEERELLLNPAARTQALAAFNWVAGVYTNNAESVLFAFLPSGEYFSVQWAEANGFIGFERGGFSQYGDELYVNVQQNDDGEALLCDPSQGGDCSDIMLPIAVGASDLTAYPGTPDEFVFARENVTGTGIEGIWKAADDTVLMMFLPGNVYVAIQWEEANGFVGFERGTYSLTDDQLSVTVSQNDDGEALICQLEAGTGCSEQTLTISVDMDSLVVNPGVDDFMLHRAL